MIGEFVQQKLEPAERLLQIHYIHAPFMWKQYQLYLVDVYKSRLLIILMSSQIGEFKLFAISIERTVYGM